MELQKYDEPRTTTHYWGYRELSADELLMVGGGDVGDYGDGGDRGYGDGSNYGGSGGEADASLGCNLVGVFVGGAVGSRFGWAAGGIAGALATEMCEQHTA